MLVSIRRTAKRVQRLTLAFTRERWSTGVVYLPMGEGFVRDPYPHYARLRERDPVHWSDLLRGWVLFRHRDVDTVQRDHERFSSSMVNRARPEYVTKVTETPGLLGLDPPDHTRLRALVNKAFTPRSIAAMRPRIAAIVDERLAGIVRKTGGVDLMAELAVPLPITVIAEMIGVPPDDRERFKRWSVAVGRTIEPSISARRLLQGRDAARDLGSYFRDAIARRRSDPGDDLISALIAAEEDGQRLDEVEMVAMLRLLLVAGNETTTNVIGNGVLALLHHPDQLDRLREEPEIIDDAIEELLRFDSPVQMGRRFAVRETEIDGVVIRKGDRLLPLMGAGNRDPEAYDHPDRLDLGRMAGRGPTRRHMSFGSGIHFCLGAALSRLEGAVAIGELVTRFPRLRLADDPPVFRRQIALRGLERLPVRVA